MTSQDFLMDLLNEGNKPSQQAQKAEMPSYTHAPESDTSSRVEALIDAIRSSHADITSDYNDWLKVGFALAREFGESGRGYFHAISSLYPDYDQAESDTKYTECLKSDNGRTDMGEFFIKNRVVTEKEFINKVMFYIWNDVCKDHYSALRLQNAYFMRDSKDTYFTFAELFSGRHKKGVPDTEPKDLILGFMNYLKSEDEENSTDDTAQINEGALDNNQQ